MSGVKYYDINGRRRKTSLAQAARLTKTEAQVERERFVATTNEDAAERLARRRPTMIGAFLVGTYLPFKRRRWKLSTAVTTEDRIRRHILDEIGDHPIGNLDRNALQELLDRKAELLGTSVIDHLRFDLRAIFEMA